MNIQTRDVLLTLSIKYSGNWNKIYSSIKKREVLKEEEYQKAHYLTKANYITLLDEDYPQGLKNITTPPFILYYYGNKSLLGRKYRLTVVGSRKPTLYQNDNVYRLISESEALLDNKLIVISGMAKGIDQISMQAAIDNNASVIACLGSGIDNPYPIDNKAIYEYCKSNNGLVISEYPTIEKPQPEYFLLRNRIMVNLADVLFVGAGKNKSGTSASVRMALENNKDVCALPCDISGDDLTNTIIQEGASSILSSRDLVDLIKSSYDFK